MINKPDINRLKPVEVKDIELISRYFREYPSPRSAYNVVNLMNWGTQFNAHWLEYEGRLIIYNNAWSCILMPIGPHLSPEQMSTISATFCASGRCGNFTLVDLDYIDQYFDNLDEFEIVRDDTNADYIYLSEMLANLSGKKLQKKKNLISQFIRLYGEYSVEVVTAKDRDECLNLSDDWSEKHQELEEGYVYEKKALTSAFEHYDILGISGRIIRLNDKMIAFCLFSEQKNDMAIVHFEKYDNEYKGAAQLINWETAKYLHTKYHYVNREEDMGLLGLRKAKQSYQPINHLVSCRLIRKKKNQLASGY
jgi:hypothetical protein